jgi:NAD(P)-dependent dehydrogenase (short-subunit alcohol dehydrogenase family)
MNAGLTGRTIIVTGAAGGIGSATARLLAAAGANIVATDYAQDGEASPMEAVKSSISRPPTTDEDLMAAIATGDSDAFAELVRRHHRRVGRLIVELQPRAADRNLNACLPKVAIKDPNENPVSIAYSAK